MPVGDRAIVEITVDRLVESGVTDITLCVGYLAHLIEAVFNGRPRAPDSRTSTRTRRSAPPARFGSSTGSTDTFLVMNGDLLTDLEFRELIDVHRGRGTWSRLRPTSGATRSTTAFSTSSGRVARGSSGTRKSPRLASTVSMGIYVMEPEVLEHVPAGYFDFPDLVQALLETRTAVGTFPFSGFWLDIGRRDDYEEALARWAERTSEDHEDVAVR